MFSVENNITEEELQAIRPRPLPYGEGRYAYSHYDVFHCVQNLLLTSDCTITGTRIAVNDSVKKDTRGQKAVFCFEFNHPQLEWATRRRHHAITVYSDQSGREGVKSYVGVTDTGKAGMKTGVTHPTVSTQTTRLRSNADPAEIAANIVTEGLMQIIDLGYTRKLLKLLKGQVTKEWADHLLMEIGRHVPGLTWAKVGAASVDFLVRLDEEGRPGTLQDMLDALDPLVAECPLLKQVEYTADATRVMVVAAKKAKKQEARA